MFGGGFQGDVRHYELALLGEKNTTEKGNRRKRFFCSLKLKLHRDGRGDKKLAEDPFYLRSQGPAGGAPI